ncbi:hypothetical protein ABK040_015043 [Willaertia magna]
MNKEHFKELFLYLKENYQTRDLSLELNILENKNLNNLKQEIIDKQLFKLVREMQKNEGRGISGYSSMKSGFLFSAVYHNTVTIHNLFDWLINNLQWNDLHVNTSLIVLMCEKKIIKVIKPSKFSKFSCSALHKELLTVVNSRKGDSGLNRILSSITIQFLNPYKPRLIVIGGGIAGLTILKSLSDRYSVILIDKKDYFEFIPAIPFLIQNVEKKVTINYSELVKKYNFTFIQGSVKKVTESEIYLKKNVNVLNGIPRLFTTTVLSTSDRNNDDNNSLQNEMVIELHEDENNNSAKNKCQLVKQLQQKDVDTTNEEEEEKILSFDYLLISTGAGLNLYNHPLFNSETNDKITFINAYEGISLKDSSEICDKTDKPICVVGGGLVAVEIAGELIEKYSNKKKIILIQRSNKLLSQYEENAHEDIYNYFKEKGMEIMLSTTTESINGNELKLFNKEKQEQLTIKTDVCFICYGSSPQTNFLKENMSHSLDENNFVIVNNQFRVKSNDENNNYYSNIFAAGDVTNINEDKTAKIAFQHVKSVKKILQQLIYCKTSNVTAELSLYENKDISKPLPRVVRFGKRGMIIKDGHKVVSGRFLRYVNQFHNYKGMSYAN